jgi:hypothetical protein
MESSAETTHVETGGICNSAKSVKPGILSADTGARVEQGIGAGSQPEYRVPVLISRFPFRQHLQYPAIRADMEKFYYGSLHDAARRKFDTYHGAYIDTGASFTAYVYPDGDASRLMAVSRFFGPWSFIDDLIDNSVDARYLTDSIARYRAALSDPHTAEGAFAAIAEFFTRGDWDPKALAFCKKEFHRYIDSTSRLRMVEIDQQAIPLAAYQEIRSTNSAMNVCFALIVYVMPQLVEPFLDAVGLPAFQRAWTYLNKNMGLMLDLYAGEAIRPEVCRFTHTVRIIHRDSPECTWQQAADRAVGLFYEYESEADAALGELAVTHPNVARALRYAQGGTVMWLRDMRGLRYAAIQPVPRT